MKINIRPKLKRFNFANLKLINNMVHIKSGSFMMGSPKTEEGRDHDEDFHKVTITKDFYLGAYPVTQGEWEDLMGYNPIINCYKKDLIFARDYNNIAYLINLNKPIIEISWKDADKYCKRLTKQEQKKGNIPINWHYCLPTEAQWEYACRAGSQGKYYNGYTNLDDIAWYWENSEHTLQRIGQKKPNAWGLYDMLGNVWEYCSDWYAANLGVDSVIDPKGPATGKYRISRGISWRCKSYKHSCALRACTNPVYRLSDHGFRVALCFKKS